MKKISFKTKIEVGVVIFFVALLSASSVLSVTRTISNTQDNIDTFIRASNGNYWEATGDNFESAVSSMNSSKGVLHLPVCSITVDTPVSYRQLVVEGEGVGGFQGNYGYTQITLTGSGSITIGNGGVLRNLKVYCDGSWTADYAVKYLANNGWASGSWGHTNLIENVEITNQNSWGTSGVGLNISAIDHSIALASFSHIHIGGFNRSLYIYTRSIEDIGFINGNNFYDIRLTNALNGITIDGGSANKFFGIELDPRTNPTTEIGIDIKSGTLNRFYGFMPWDWNVCPNAKMVNIENESQLNYVELLSGDSSKVSDLGEHNKIVYEDFGSSLPYTVGYYMYKNTNYDTAYYQPYYIIDQNGEMVYDSVEPTAVIETVENTDNITIHLSGETYEVDDWLLAIDKVTILGDNKYSTIFHPHSDVIGSVYAFCAMVNCGDDVTFKDITFDVDQHRQYCFHNSGSRKYNWTFENCVFKGANDTYLLYYNLVSNSKFIDCDFYGKETYVYNCSNLTFERCNFYGASVDALHIYLSENIGVHNCKFFDYGDDAIYLQSSGNCTIDDNDFDSHSGDAAIVVTNCADNIISKNIMRSGDEGIYMTGSSDYNILALNDFRHTTSGSTFVGANNANVGNIGVIH